MKKLRKNTLFAAAGALVFLLCSCGSPLPDPAPASSGVVSRQEPVSSAEPPASSAPVQAASQLFVDQVEQLDIVRSDTSLQVFSAADGGSYLNTCIGRYQVCSAQNELYVPQRYLQLFGGLSEAVQSGTDAWEPLLLKMNLPEKMSLLTPYLCVGESGKVYCIFGVPTFPLPEHVADTEDNRCIYREYPFEGKIVQAESNGFDSFLLTEQGELYCLGTMSLYGGYTVVTDEFYFKPVQVTTPGPVRKIVANERSLYILCEDGMIYSAPVYSSPEGYANGYDGETLISSDRNVFQPVSLDIRAADLLGGGMNFCIMALDGENRLYLYPELEDFRRVTEESGKDPSKPKQQTHPVFEKVDGIGEVGEIRTQDNGNRILLETVNGEHYTFGYLEYDAQNDRLNYTAPTPVDCSRLPEGTELYPFCSGILAVPAQGANLYSGTELSINKVYFLPRAAEQFVPAEKVYWKLFD